MAQFSCLVAVVVVVVGLLHGRQLMTHQLRYSFFSGLLMLYQLGMTLAKNNPKVKHPLCVETESDVSGVQGFLPYVIILHTRATNASNSTVLGMVLLFFMQRCTTL
jgi:hypothetical protein